MLGLNKVNMTKFPNNRGLSVQFRHIYAKIQMYLTLSWQVKTKEAIALAKNQLKSIDKISAISPAGSSHSLQLDECNYKNRIDRWRQQQGLAVAVYALSRSSECKSINGVGHSIFIVADANHISNSFCLLWSIAESNSKPSQPEHFNAIFSIANCHDLAESQINSFSIRVAPRKRINYKLCS